MKDEKRRKSKRRRRNESLLTALAVAAISIGVLFLTSHVHKPQRHVSLQSSVPFAIENIPPYSNSPFCEMNGGIPYFSSEEIVSERYTVYSELDGLGRCGKACACLDSTAMPTEERGEIGMIRPSGWHTVRYNEIIEDRYLYNRCHLIAYMLTGENANPMNLITGTRYMNVSGMLPFESMTASYLIDSGNHVMYRVTPVFVGNELVARGVLMEAYSVEDSGKGLQFNVFVYNVQPGIEIDYLTGDSKIAEIG